jgi:hypothetical protein
VLNLELVTWHFAHCNWNRLIMRVQVETAMLRNRREAQEVTGAAELN